MAYAGRHRALARRSAPRSNRRRVVYARLFDQQTLTNNAAASRTVLLADLETRISTEIWGATVLKIWGTATILAGAGITATGWVFMGTQVARGELADLAAGHPDPDYVSTNNDKYSSWLGLSYFPTPVTANTNQPLVYRWVHSKRYRINQPDDTLLVSYKYNFGQAASTMTVQNVINVAVALP